MLGSSFLDYFVINWNILFSLIFFIAIPSIFLRFMALFYVEIANNTLTHYSINSIKYSLIILFTIFSAILISWVSPELFLFNNQLNVDNRTLSYFKSGILLFISFFYIYNIKNKYALFHTILILLFYLTISLLSTAQSFYTLIFILEFTNLLVFGLLVVNALPSFFNNTIASGRVLNSIFLFFWINAFSALILFMFLFCTITGWSELEFNISSQLDFFFNTNPNSVLQIGLLNNLINTFILDSKLLVYVIFITSFAFKLGLPPFIFWKLSLFENSPLRFIYTYAILYTPIVFFTFFYIFIGLFSNVSLCEFIYVTTLTLITIMILMTIVLTESVNSLGFFFALSSAYTFILLYLYFFFNNFTYDKLLQTPSINFEFIKTYVLFYIVAVSLLITTLKHKSTILGKNPLTCLPMTGHFKSNIIFSRLTLSIVFFSLAGLPPFPSFFIKLNFLTLINNAILTNTVNFIIFYLFIFGQLIFYFRIVRFFYTTADSLNVNINKYGIENNPTRLNTLNLPLLFILTGFVFIFNDVFILIFV